MWVRWWISNVGVSQRAASQPLQPHDGGGEGPVFLVPCAGGAAFISAAARYSDIDAFGPRGAARIVEPCPG